MVDGEEDEELKGGERVEDEGGESKRCESWNEFGLCLEGWQGGGCGPFFSFDTFIVCDLRAAADDDDTIAGIAPTLFT